jgi:PAS domain S-box-containing protein
LIKTVIPVKVFVQLSAWAVLYFITAWGAIEWARNHDSIVPLWPAAGVALAAVVIGGRIQLLAVLIGTLAILYFRQAHPATSTQHIVAIGNLLAPWAAALILSKARFVPQFTHIRDPLVLIGATLVSAIISATINAAGLWWDASPEPIAYKELWLMWVAAHSVGILIAAPLLMAWLSRTQKSESQWIIQFATCMVSVTLISWLIFVWGPIDRAFTFLVFIPLAWAAIAFHAKGAATAVGIVTAMAVWGIDSKTATFLNFSEGDAFCYIWLQSFLIVCGITTLLLAVISDERQNQEALRTSEERLRAALAIAGMSAYEWDIHTDIITGQGQCLQPDGVESTTGAAIVQLMLPEDRPAALHGLSCITPEHPGLSIEYRFPMSDGKIQWIQNIGRGEFDKTGFLVIIRGLAHDITDRKRSELALSDSEHWFRMVADASPAMLWMTNSHDLCTYLSDQWYEFTGQQRESDPSKGWSLAAHPHDQIAAQTAFAQAAANQEPFTFDYRIRAADGSYRWCINMGRPRRSPTGDYLGYAGLVLDVSDRIRAEQALYTSEQRFRVLVNALPQVVWITEANGKTTEFNQRWYEYTGLNADHSLGLEWHKVVHPDDLPHCQAAWKNAVENGSLYEVELRYRRADGTYRWFLARALPMPTWPGQLGTWLGTSTDIEDRRRESDALGQALRQLEESFALLDTVFDKAPVGLTFLDPQFRYIRINKTLAQLNALPPEEHIGKTIAEALPNVWPHVSPLLHQVRDTNQPLLNVEIYAPVPDRPKQGHWLASYYPIWVRNELLGYGIVAMDITQQKQAEQTLLDADKRKDEFLAILAHELRNPLAPLRTGVQVLKMQAPQSPAGQKVLDIMERQLGHMVRLIDDLLDISRITQGKIELRRQNISLQTLVHTAMEVSQPLIDSSKHQLQLIIPTKEIPICVDPIRIAQVISNLINNAAKYTPTGGHIKIEATQEENQAVLRVTDNGLGIAQETLPWIFDLFTQVGQTLDRAQGGLGIGLSISRRLVEMHGGTLTVSSPGPGKGSTFAVWLPCEGSASFAPKRGVRASQIVDLTSN